MLYFGSSRKYWKLFKKCKLHICEPTYICIEDALTLAVRQGRLLHSRKSKFSYQKNNVFSLSVTRFPAMRRHLNATCKEHLTIVPYIAHMCACIALVSYSSPAAVRS